MGDKLRKSQREVSRETRQRRTREAVVRTCY